MTKEIETVPSGLLMRLRKLSPKRPLSYSESLTVAKVQAVRLRQLLEVESAAMPLQWIVTILPGVMVEPLAAHELGEDISGLTKRVSSGYLVRINRNKGHSHRRFTLAHELKHVIDYPYAPTLHRALGRGDAELRERQIERICDHFAAHLLMPTMLVKRAWTRGFQETTVLAGLFGVSEEAIRIRLEHLGFIDRDEQPAELYFRRSHLRFELCGIPA
jgi:Zn-dependent peptidase ImmA (M78 family)